MRVGQSCFQQKSTNKPFSNLTSILTNPKVSSNVADPQRKHFSLQRINTFLLTLMKTKQAIASSGVTKTITCYPACSLALKSIQELDGAQVKDSILIILCNYIAELQEEACRFKQSLLDQTNSLCTQKAFNKEEIGQLTNLVLSELMEKLKNKLKQGFSKKQVYGLIHFKWTNQLVKKFIDLLDHPYQSLSQQKTEIERLYSSSFHKRQIYQKNNPNHKSSLRYEQMATNELFGHIENEKVSLLLQREFEMLSNKLKNKDLQCRNLHSQINEFAEIIKKQIDCLNENQAENQALKDYILLSSSQAESLNKKCRFLEKQLHKLEQEVQKQKLSLPNEQTYYVNPLWQKQQLQQKYLVELIQLQSDLLLQKDQVKALVDLALQQIKISHQVLYDLRASKFMICRFDQEVSKLLKGVTAFDKVNLEQHLILRQEGAYSESSPQMHKSTISTFSQVDTESKMRSQKQIMLFENLQQEYKQQ